VTGEDPVPEPLDASGKASYSPDYYLNVGDTVTPNYAGDANHDVSSTTVTPNIQPAVTAMTLASSANPAPMGGDVTITATVANESTSIPPFGTVHFVVSGQEVDVPLDENGQAAIDLIGFPPGSYPVQASYHDDTGPIPDFTDSQATTTQQINGACPDERGATDHRGDGRSRRNHVPHARDMGEQPDDVLRPVGGLRRIGRQLHADRRGDEHHVHPNRADVSHTIRVLESATNPNGIGAAVSSAATGTVQASPGAQGTPTVAAATVKGLSASLPVSCTGPPERLAS
jgi:hypothetical protein